MDLYEEGGSKVFGTVFDLTKIQGRASVTPRQDTVITYFHVKMGINYHELYLKLPRTTHGVDSIWFSMDRVIKNAQFIPIVESISTEKLAGIYILKVVVRQGVPVLVVSDRDVRFTSNFWRKFHEKLGTKLLFSTTYHPQTDGQSERMSQTLEDILRVCVLNFGGS